MKIIGFNGSPRKSGNTSTILRAVLKGAEEAGAETTEVRIHDLNMKGCMGCLSCRARPGLCAQKDDLSPFLEAIKTADGIVMGAPIYMFRLAGQIKLLVDRMYFLYTPKEGGGYGSAVPPGKTFAMVISQGADNTDQYFRSARWLAGMGGTGFGMEDVGYIVQGGNATTVGTGMGRKDDAKKVITSGRAAGPIKNNTEVMAEAIALGRRLIKKQK